MTEYNYVRDIPDEFVLITDQQEIEHIGEMIGADNIADEFGCIFVDIYDGDYGMIYGISSCVPWLHARVYNVDHYLESSRYRLELEYTAKQQAAEIDIIEGGEMIKEWIHDDISVRLFDHYKYSGSGLLGRSMLSYVLRSGDQAVFYGDDYGPSPLHAHDSIDAIYGLLSFLTIQPGDTDAEYFEGYTDLQLEWIDSSEADDLRMMIYDHEAKQEA